MHGTTNIKVYGSRSDCITASPTITLTEVCYNPEGCEFDFR